MIVRVYSRARPGRQGVEVHTGKEGRGARVPSLRRPVPASIRPEFRLLCSIRSVSALMTKTVILHPDERLRPSQFLRHSSFRRAVPQHPNSPSSALGRTWARTATETVSPRSPSTTTDHPPLLSIRSRRPLPPCCRRPSPPPRRHRPWQFPSLVAASAQVRSPLNSQSSRARSRGVTRPRRATTIRIPTLPTIRRRSENLPSQVMTSFILLRLPFFPPPPLQHLRSLPSSSPHKRRRKLPPRRLVQVHPLMGNHHNKHRNCRRWCSIWPLLPVRPWWVVRCLSRWTTFGGICESVPFFEGYARKRHIKLTRAMAFPRIDRRFRTLHGAPRAQEVKRPSAQAAEVV